MVFLATLVRTNWFDLLQTLGIVAGLVFTGVTMHVEGKVRRVSNSFEITKQHREIWRELFDRPELNRVLDPRADLRLRPISENERLFVHFLFLHLATAFRAMENGMYVLPEELRRDIAEFLNLPIPKAVWDSTRHLKNRDFVAFVDSYRR